LHMIFALRQRGFALAARAPQAPLLPGLKHLHARVRPCRLRLMTVVARSVHSVPPVMSCTGLTHVRPCMFAA
jgi:hypothetical protein